jgi:hypothetical protein
MDTQTAKPNKPTVYHGDRDTQLLESWIFVVNRYLRLSKTEPELKVDIASTYLGGHANTWFQHWYPIALEVIHNHPDSNYSQHAPRYISWETFVDDLRSAFQPPNSHQHLRDQWFNLSQKGTVAEYVSAFRALRLQLETTEDEALDKFIRGLKYNTRKEILVRGPNTVDEAIKMADRYDTAAFPPPFARLDSRPRPHYNPTANWQGPAPMEIDTMTGKSLGKLDDATRESLRLSGSCFRCRQKGHIAKFCPKKQENFNLQ